MKIECLTTFLHGRDRFERGDVRNVPIEQGTYFVTAGWAKSTEEVSVAAEPPGQPEATLSVQSATHKQGARHG